MSTAGSAGAARRLFVGTFLSDQQKESLSHLSQADELSQFWHLKMRWVKAEKLHVTWLFLGQVDDEQQKSICAGLQSACTRLPATALAYSKTELFPNGRSPRLVALVPDRVDDAVQLLYGALADALSPYCEKTPERKFRPHVTLCRFPKGSSGGFDLPDGWPRQSHLLPLVQDVASVSLIESHLGRGADEYEVLEQFPLRGD